MKSSSRSNGAAGRQGGCAVTIYRYEFLCEICSVSVSAQQTHNRPPKTCGGPACVSELKRRSRLSSPRDVNRLRAVQSSPTTGPFETHFSAKDWSLKAPDGSIHKFRNLSLFIRNNLKLFAPQDTLVRGKGNTNANVYLGRLRPRSDQPHWSEWNGWRWHDEPVADAAWRSQERKQTSDTLNAYIGDKIRLQRKMLGVNASELGAILGVTKQQFSKYEKGIDGISAANLHLICQKMSISVDGFYPTLPNSIHDPAKDTADRQFSILKVFLATQDGLALARSILQISALRRRRILDLLQTLADRVPETRLSAKQASPGSERGRTLKRAPRRGSKSTSSARQASIAE